MTNINTCSSPSYEAFCLTYAGHRIGARAYASAMPESLLRSTRYRSERARRLLRRPSIATRLQALGVELPEPSRAALAKHMARPPKATASAGRGSASLRANRGRSPPDHATSTGERCEGTSALTAPISASLPSGAVDADQLIRLIEAARACSGIVTVRITIELRQGDGP